MAAETSHTFTTSRGTINLAGPSLYKLDDILQISSNDLTQLGQWLGGAQGEELKTIVENFRAKGIIHPDDVKLSMNPRFYSLIKSAGLADRVKAVGFNVKGSNTASGLSVDDIRRLLQLSDILSSVDEVKTTTTSTMTSFIVKPTITSTVSSVTVPSSSTKFRKEDAREGMAVSWRGRDDSVRKGVIIKVNPVNAKIRTVRHKIFSVPYSMLAPIDEDLSYLLRSETTMVPVQSVVGGDAKFTKANAYIGQKVYWDHRDRSRKTTHHLGTIYKLNPKTADIQEDSGVKWRIYYEDLKPST